MNETIILETAFRLFTTQGIQPFTMDEIAARLAISKKTLYRFFTSRADLVQQVCRLVAANFNQALEEADQADADNLQRVLSHMTVNMDFCKKTSVAFFTDLQKHYPVEYTHLVHTLNNFIYPRVLKVLEEGIVEGVFRGSLHPQLVVTILQQHIQKDFEFAAELVNDYSKDEVFRQALYLFLYGVIAPEAIPRLENELKKYSFATRLAQPKEIQQIETDQHK
ncbi:TetR/AcrR family transcriptional regulator [Niastella caeni]|uniref:TetR/AcrR family transcriptional regulator n=1 Tax=Niastella caeni TaxID=2569763 RepID=A0A4V4GZ67_9BACT|nr:TetR/AcrR family transcriptional regulator [Niastella caeni]THU31536.1 TetR/AcrR family transcriptional regulator [Niastella caeni]